MIMLLYCVLISAYTECCVQWGSPTGVWGTQVCAEESNLSSEKLQTHIIQKQFKELRVFSLVMRQLGDHDLHLQILKQRSRERGDSHSEKCEGTEPEPMGRRPRKTD